MALGGCGLAPVYGKNAPALALRNAVALTTPETVIGFRLRRRMIDRLGAAETPRFNLTASFTMTTKAATITGDGNTSRISLIGVSQWSLQDAAGETTLITDTATTFTSYSATGSTVATVAAKDDAEARLAIAIADLITNRILLFMSGRTR